MIALSCTNLSKSYGITPIIEDISFTVTHGDKIGLIGVNGAGKTTLMKILAGKESSDSGDLFMSKELALGYLEQNTNVESNASAFEFLEAIYEDVFAIETKMRQLEKDMATPADDYDTLLSEYAHLQEAFERNDGYAIESNIRGILNGLGFDEEDHHRPIMSLSGGQRSRVGIARMLLKHPDILLLDEPTNHLDIDAIKWLEAFLSDYSGTVILISHDRYFLDQVVGKIYEIERLELSEYHGNYSFYVKEKQIQYEAELKQYELQQKEIAKQEDLIRKFKERGTEKLAKRARSREKRLDHVDRIDKPALFKRHLKLSLTASSTSGKDVMRVENLAKSYGETKIFEAINFEIYRGERIGLIGPNGVGKTTLFKVLLGQIPYNQGKIELGHQVEPGYYDQELTNLNEDATLLAEIHDERPLMTQTEIRGLLGAFMFSGDDIEKEVKVLSGGERSRISLLKLMLSESNLLFLDEPTNHLDIYSKETLEDALLNYEGTLFAISHDRYFLNKVCDKIFELTQDGLNIYWGNYDYYQEKVLEKEKPPVDDNTQPEMTKTKQKELQRKEKEKRNEAKAMKNKLAELESTIQTSEDKLHALQLELCEEAVFSVPEKASAVQKEIDRLELTIANLYEELESLL